MIKTLAAMAVIIVAVLMAIGIKSVADKNKAVSTESTIMNYESTE